MNKYYKNKKKVPCVVLIKRYTFLVLVSEIHVPGFLRWMDGCVWAAQPQILLSEKKKIIIKKKKKKKKKKYNWSYQLRIGTQKYKVK